MKRTEGRITNSYSRNSSEVKLYIRDAEGYSASPGQMIGVQGNKARQDSHHITSTWNASEGMTTEDAVNALKNYEEMKIKLKQCFDVINLMPCETLSSDTTIIQIGDLLAKLDSN